LDVSLKDLLERGGRRMDLLDLEQAKLLDRDEVSAVPGHLRGADWRARAGRGRISILSCEGLSLRETTTSSSSCAAMEVPEKSATIGSFRQPRSTSTASSTVPGLPWSKSSSRAAFTVRP